MSIKAELDSFRDDHKITSKGSISVVVQLTRAFSKDTLPDQSK